MDYSNRGVFNAKDRQEFISDDHLPIDHIPNLAFRWILDFNRNGSEPPNFFAILRVLCTFALKAQKNPLFE